MALVLSGERSSAAATSSSLLTRLVAWFGKARANRAQRIALDSLLELDPHQLDDLGINRGDLFDAMHTPRATRLLNDRRLRRRRA